MFIVIYSFTKSDFAAPPKTPTDPPQYQTASNDPATRRPELLQQSQAKVT
jgi:hypothetical protein